jgi:UPF0271 protein
MMKIDINCDLGEGYGAYHMGDDEALLQVVSSANIACGFHAGDPVIMDQTVQWATTAGVDVGAHIGFPDLPGFGRRKMELSSKELETLTLYQLGALYGIASKHGKKLTHATFHGALGNMSFAEAALADTLVRAVRTFDKDMIIIAPPWTELERAAKEVNLPVANVVFADRAYDDKGLLVSRKLPGAVIHDPDAVCERITRMLCDQEITSINNVRLKVRIDSILVHGDTAGSVLLAQQVKDTLVNLGAKVTPVSQVIQ